MGRVTQLHTYFPTLPTPNNYYVFVTALIFFWGVYDPASTYFAIYMTGTIEHEANPLIKIALETHPVLLVPIKLIAMLAVGGIAVAGKQYITATPYWKVFFIIWITAGAFVSTLNVYAGLI